MFRSPLLAAALLAGWPAVADPLTSTYVVERQAGGVDIRFGARPRTISVTTASRGAWVYFASATSDAARTSVQVARGGGEAPSAEPAEACATVGPVPELIEARY